MIRQKLDILLASVIIVVIVSASFAFASIKIAWSSWEGGGGMVCTNNGAPTGYLTSNSILQLIWSPTNVAAPTVLNPGDWIGDGTNLLGGQVLLDMRGTDGLFADWGMWGAYSTTFDATNYGLADNYFVTPAGSAYVYQRVFDVKMGNTPTAGDYFAISQPAGYAYPLVDQETSPGMPDDCFLVMGGTPQFETDLQIVPEPATFTLFGLGCILISLRRRLTRQS
jgi:hypothetical protein